MKLKQLCLGLVGLALGSANVQSSYISQPEKYHFEQIGTHTFQSSVGDRVQATYDIGAQTVVFEQHSFEDLRLRAGINTDSISIGLFHENGSLFRARIGKNHDIFFQTPVSNEFMRQIGIGHTNNGLYGNALIHLGKNLPQLDVQYRNNTARLVARYKGINVGASSSGEYFVSRHMLGGQLSAHNVFTNPIITYRKSDTSITHTHNKTRISQQVNLFESIDSTINIDFNSDYVNLNSRMLWNFGTNNRIIALIGKNPTVSYAYQNDQLTVSAELSQKSVNIFASIRF